MPSLGPLFCACDHGSALRAQVHGQDPGAVEGGLQPDRPVLEHLVLAVAVGGLGAGQDLRSEPGQIPQVRPAERRSQ